MEYQQRIKEIRKAHGHTQAKTAEKLSMTQQQWQKYEQGKNELPIRYLIEFCKIYKADANYILGLSADELER